MQVVPGEMNEYIRHRLTALPLFVWRKNVERDGAQMLALFGEGKTRTGDGDDLDFAFGKVPNDVSADEAGRAGDPDSHAAIRSRGSAT
jgi:hypothetical protein